MTPADVDAAADALRRGEWGEWGERRDFFAFAVAHPACRPVVADDGGEIVGTGVGTSHGPSGWIGLVFVARAHRGRGLGTAITDAVVGELRESGCQTLLLVATELGRPIYERLGFEVVGAYLGLTAISLSPEEPDPSGSSLRPFAPADLDALCALDAWATGEDRAHLLRAITHSGDGIVVADRLDPSALRGFSLPSRWGGWPTIAVGPVDAVELLAHRRRLVGPDRETRTAILAENRAGLEALATVGWRETWRGVRMRLGPALDWHPEAIWGQFNFAIG